MTCHIFWMRMEAAPPPPLQRLAMPNCPGWSEWTRWFVILVPDIPNGWPMQIAPPWTFTFDWKRSNPDLSRHLTGNFLVWLIGWHLWLWLLICSSLALFEKSEKKLFLSLLFGELASCKIALEKLSFCDVFGALDLCGQCWFVVNRVCLWLELTTELHISVRKKASDQSYQIKTQDPGIGDDHHRKRFIDLPQRDVFLLQPGPVQQLLDAFAWRRWPVDWVLGRVLEPDHLGLRRQPVPVEDFRMASYFILH